MIETVFSLTGIAMLGWLLLILLPSWKVTRLLAKSNVGSHRFHLEAQTYQSAARMNLLRIFEWKLTGMMKELSPGQTVPTIPADAEDAAILRYFNQLAVVLIMHYAEQSKSNTNHIIKRVCDYIHTHFKKDISLMEMAQYANMSISYFNAWLTACSIRRSFSRGHLGSLLCYAIGRRLKPRCERLTSAGFNCSTCVKDAVKLVVKLEIVDTDYRNSYPLWVYPDSGTAVIPSTVVVCRHLDETTQAMLLSGSKVLLALDPERISGGGANVVYTGFLVLFHVQKYGAPGTLSIYCDPEHPALKHFPSEIHTNWQWWNLIKNAKTMNLDVLPNMIEPIVGVVDNVLRQFKLGLLFEAKLGEGKLLVCSMELLKQLDRPEAKQLFTSLLSYMDSEAFAPTVEITLETLEKLVQSNEGKRHDLVALQQNADQYG